MKKVYVLTMVFTDGDFSTRVFTTKEKAEQFAKELFKMDSFKPMYDSYKITECPLMWADISFLFKSKHYLINLNNYFFQKNLTNWYYYVIIISEKRKRGK